MAESPHPRGRMTAGVLFRALEDMIGHSVARSREITESGVLQIAYAFGKPVVASALGGFRESVEEGGNGHLFPPGHFRACARVLTSLLGDPGRRAEMGRRSRELSERRSWDAIARQTLALYES